MKTRHLRFIVCTIFLVSLSLSLYSQGISDRSESLEDQSENIAALSLWSSESDELKLESTIDFEVEKTDKAKKVIYGELLGVGLIYSINYDVRLSKYVEGDGFGVRIGASVLGPVFVPVQFNYLIGGPRHYLEVASGVTFASRNFDVGNGIYGSFNVSPTSSVAYRFQPSYKGFFFRIGADVFHQQNISDDGFRPWAGVAMGYSFE